MTYEVSEIARERAAQRAKRKAQRGLARKSAKNLLVEFIDKLRSEEGPDWYTEEQHLAWLEELDCQRRRLIGCEAANIHVWRG